MNDERQDDWHIDRERGVAGFPFAICGPFADGLPGTAVLGCFAYRPHAETAMEAVRCGVPPMSRRTLAEATGDYAAAGLPEPMTAERFRHLRAMTDLSFRDLGAALGMRGRHAATHLREMADGVRVVPGPTGIALEIVALGLTSDDALAEALEEAMEEAQFDGTTIAELARAAVRALRDLLGRRPA